MQTDAQILKGISEIIRESGKTLTKAKDARKVATSKGGHANFVTEYDKKNQHFLMKKLHELLPEANFLGEEEGEDVFKSVYSKGYTFVIDPIDGTTNFIWGYHPSVISIGLLKDGKPFIGVIYDPYMDELFAALKGKGSTLNGKKIHVTEHPLRDSLVAFGTWTYQPEYAKKSLELAYGYLSKAADIRRSGSAAYDLCMVACGRTALYFELKLGLWDFCAGALIVTEAGGKVCDIYGKALKFRGQSSVMARAASVKKSELLLLEE
jgi:myo-inositol-1(or 4)-monophosphatase